MVVSSQIRTMLSSLSFSEKLCAHGNEYSRFSMILWKDRKSVYEINFILVIGFSFSSFENCL